MVRKMPDLLEAVTHTIHASLAAYMLCELWQGPLPLTPEAVPRGQRLQVWDLREGTQTIRVPASVDNWYVRRVNAAGQCALQIPLLRGHTYSDWWGQAR